ncbi:hypothetical protein VHUM_03931 [Vanrija humicola]|uniref:Ams2/SPT21 N-terminal domain-containing protein n=1 Tax=Vanrija humicola TaxID=5417 RepID=A0A7D8UZ58_VANHU|nr:hypothetical protein VHUM_03931 [Vanrija humicola]
MPPSPGKIQPLPIKVLYTIDTSPQSYLAVLPDKQDVYVHPTAPASSELLGSCSLKALARGICYASPECVPNQSSLDFSVYNLEPSASLSTSRAFPTPAPTPLSSWAGKGFLSWALSETGSGSTLARGRLVREYEFSSACFSDGAGLEGLMAAAAASGSDEADGKGWGLEVTLTLRQLNPEGKREFAGRSAFEEMLVGGKSTASAPIAVASRSSSGAFAKPAPPTAKPPSPHRRPASIQPAASGSAPLQRPQTVQPAPPAAGPSSDTKGNLTSAVISLASRESTPPRSVPPTAAPVRTPPPPSPSRAALMSLLKSEGKMSPEMARKLANNQFLVRLLKALPPGANGEAGGSPSRSVTRPPVPTPPATTDACYNCGATESDQWMTKKLKDGRAGRVCNEVWEKEDADKKAAAAAVAAAAAAPIVPPVRSSPRLNRTRHSDSAAPPPESPRKRQRTKAHPHPSPRMATRSSAKEAADKPSTTDATTPTPSLGGSSALNFASHFPFSPGNPSTRTETPASTAARLHTIIVILAPRLPTLRLCSAITTPRASLSCSKASRARGSSRRRRRRRERRR